MATREEFLKTVPLQELSHCFHCGDACKDVTIHAHDKIFCCEGCKLVFEILDENNLCNYYNLNATPGTKEDRERLQSEFDFLDDKKVFQQLVSFTDGTITNITFFIPQIHCSSCIWLLENLYKLDKGVKQSTVNFLKREVSLVFNEQETSLKNLAILLSQIGYKPHISLNNIHNSKPTISNKKVYYKLGVAFFCFGNIMLLSFPEYFGLSEMFDKNFRNLFGYLNILLSLPVLLYASTGFFKSAWVGLRQGRLNMDFPISLGIAVMYGRSLFEILSGAGAGYMDTFAGLIFFMLSGRLFQDKTYERLSFERDYKSYFPVAVTIIENGRETSRSLNDIKRGDRILIRNEELIPADAILIKGEAAIDYSFVTGENIPVTKKSGDKIYAGGKQVGQAIELEVVNEVSQSRLTQLWNKSNFAQNNKRNVSSIVDRISGVFTIVVVVIAVVSGIWYVSQNQLPVALNAFTAVLIITCPCALALSYPFALGNAIRILGNNKLFLKNTQVIEKMSSISDIVFDKTGTLTQGGEAGVKYEGVQFNIHQAEALCSLVNQSSHPLSRIVKSYLGQQNKYAVNNFSEQAGLGVSGVVNDNKYKVGASAFAGNIGHDNSNSKQTKVHWSENGKYMGCFVISNKYRDGVSELASHLSADYSLHILSGDNDAEKENLKNIFSEETLVNFNQSPTDKLNYIDSLQKSDKQVIMLGDGLNDAGALLQSDCGIAISDNINNFSPACDAILDASNMNQLPVFLKFSGASMKIIYASYTISFIYNSIGIWFAVQGHLSPLIAAIIMPLSTVTIVLFTTVSTNLTAMYYRIRN